MSFHCEVDSVAALIVYSRAYESEFATASVSVVLMRARRPGIAECSHSSDATMQEAA